METWPSNFPSPQISLAAGTSANVAVTNTPNGPIQQRSRFTGAPTTVSIAWQMTDALLAEFKTFHKDSLNLGSDWFLLDLPITGEGYTEAQVRFIEGRFNASAIPVGWWNVTATLDLFEVPVMSEAALVILLSEEP